MIRKILLQIKFLLIALFNITYKLIPFWFLKKLYLQIFQINLGSSSSIHSVKFFNYGNIHIGNGTTINNGCYLDNRKKITIGDNVSIAHDVKIYTYGHDIDCPKFSTKGSPVVIEDYAVLFAGAMIMPGVTIKKGAVVLPGAVVSKDVQENEVVGGNPAKVVKMRNCQFNYQIDYRYLFAL